MLTAPALDRPTFVQPGIAEAKHVTQLFAEIGFDYYDAAEGRKLTETREIEVVVINDGQPNKPKVEQVVKLIGGSWRLIDAWAPEADEF